MITISKQFSFKAKDFFDYLDQQLITSIKQARNNNMPVTLQAGTEYEQSGAKVKITEYERDKVYAAHFVSDRFDIIIKYVTEDNDQGVKITFSLPCFTSNARSMVNCKPCSITGNLKWAPIRN